jgi:predicted phosphodiesterase
VKLGLLADIHEHNNDLRLALDAFRQEQVDQVVVLGDVLELGNRIGETCRLLQEVGAIGVWGNHEFGLCYEPEERARQKYPESVLEKPVGRVARKRLTCFRCNSWIGSKRT